VVCGGGGGGTDPTINKLEGTFIQQHNYTCNNNKVCIKSLLLLLLLEYYNQPEHLETYLIKEARRLLLLQDRVARGNYSDGNYIDI
jgi:hypothetical protein